MTALAAIARDLRRDLAELTFAPPVAYVYRPLDYAWGPHAEYLERWGEPPKPVVLVGMNPGPWGMAQTGIPFGCVPLVRSWLELECHDVGRPEREHPRRPVLGFECHREEVSGARLWGWARDRWGTPESFFHTLKGELIHDRHYQTRQEARAEIFDYIEVFYNRQRRHSALGYLSPAEFEKRVNAA